MYDECGTLNETWLPSSALTAIMLNTGGIYVISACICPGLTEVQVPTWYSALASLKIGLQTRNFGTGISKLGFENGRA
jgi:hypothetical protein